MRAALEGLPEVKSAYVDLERGVAVVSAGMGVDVCQAVPAVHGKVIFSRARGILGKAPWPGKGRK